MAGSSGQRASHGAVRLAMQTAGTPGLNSVGPRKNAARYADRLYSMPNSVVRLQPVPDQNRFPAPGDEARCGAEGFEGLVCEPKASFYLSRNRITDHE